jgi:D-alanyl-D-alanine carboxypeptidase (penicillin-binding protein 5/6)
MKNKIVVVLALMLCVESTLAQVPPVPTPAAKTELPPVPAPPQLAAGSYILMDFNSLDVLVEHNAAERLEPASITKLMTTYVVFSELAKGRIKLEDTVIVSETAWRMGGSRMFIDPTMTPTVQELIRGIIIQSGNDACVALAEHIAGTEQAFADLMNHFAKELGMTGTHFQNSTGWPGDEHYMTARDIALLSAALIRDFPDYYPYYAEKEFTFNGILQHNRNSLLFKDPTSDGLKTGHTENAGFCLAASAKREGMRLISVVMRAASESARASDSQSLLNYGFRFFETVQLYEARAELARSEVWMGLADVVSLGLTDPLFVTIPRGRYGELDAQVKLLPELTAPLAPDQVVGKITVKLDDDVVASLDLVALNAVEEAGFFGRTWDGLRLWTGGLFGDDEEDADVPADSDADSATETRVDAAGSDAGSDGETGAAEAASPESAGGKPAAVEPVDGKTAAGKTTAGKTADEAPG